MLVFQSITETTFEMRAAKSIEIGFSTSGVISGGVDIRSNRDVKLDSDS